MFVGHYAVAFGAKKLAPHTSLGTLIAAAAFLDLVWPVLVLMGLEQVAVAPGITAFTPLDFISYPYSHSLLASILWGILFGGAYYAVRRLPVGALAIGLLVVSHWLLDAVAHRPDLPLTPWSDMRVGLGLWNSIPGTLIVELVLFGLGLWVYVRTTAGKDGIGRRGLAALAAFMLVLYVAAAFGPPPPSANAVAVTDLAQWLIVALAAWIDRHRIAAP